MVLSGYLALNKTATASTGDAAAAVDGNDGTRWESAQTDTEWWQVDLGEVQTLNTIKILWEGAYSKSFTIEVSTAAFRTSGALAWLGTAGTTVGSFRAYLTGITAELMARGVTIDGETITGVGMVQDSGAKVLHPVYNLNGQRVTATRKGLYIVNGKKIVVR